MTSLPMNEADVLRFFIPPDRLPALSGLPWRTPLEEWSEPVHLTFGSIIKALTALLTGSEPTRHNIYLA